MCPRHLRMYPQCLPLCHRTSRSLKYSYPSSLWRSWRVPSSHFSERSPGTTPVLGSSPSKFKLDVINNSAVLKFPPCLVLLFLQPLSLLLFSFCLFSFFLLLFWSFLSDSPWVFGLVHCSWFLTIFILPDYTLVNRNKVFLLNYSVRWWR